MCDKNILGVCKNITILWYSTVDDNRWVGVVPTSKMYDVIHGWSLTVCTGFEMILQVLWSVSGWEAFLGTSCQYLFYQDRTVRINLDKTRQVNIALWVAKLHCKKCKIIKIWNKYWLNIARREGKVFWRQSLSIIFTYKSVQFTSLIIVIVNRKQIIKTTSN